MSSPDISFRSPSSMQRIYVKAMEINRVSILFGSVTLVFSRSKAFDFQSLCIHSIPNLFPYVLSDNNGLSEVVAITKGSS